MLPDDGRVVSNFVVQALSGKPLTIYGDGSQTRSFCYIEDLVTGLVKLMNWEGGTGPMNMGNPDEYTIKELAEKVVDFNGSGTVEYHELPQDDPRQRCPDISLAKEALGWTPRVPLDHGMKATFDFFRKALS